MAALCLLEEAGESYSVRIRAAAALASMPLDETKLIMKFKYLCPVELLKIIARNELSDRYVRVEVDQTKLLSSPSPSALSKVTLFLC